MGGEVVSVKEIFEKHPTKIKNYGIVLRYDSRSGTHNMYREYRDLSAAAAVTACYREMASRHRCRARSVHVVEVKELDKPSDARRAYVKQLHQSTIKFPLPHRSIAKAKGKFCAARP